MWWQASHIQRPNTAASLLYIASNGGWTIILGWGWMQTFHNVNMSTLDIMETVQEWVWRSEHWIWYGVGNTHCLTSRQQVNLRIELKYGSGSEQSYNYYKYFVVDGPEDKHTLHTYLSATVTLFWLWWNTTMDNHWLLLMMKMMRGALVIIMNCVPKAFSHWGGWWLSSCTHVVPTSLRPHPNIFWTYQVTWRWRFAQSNVLLRKYKISEILQ